MSKQQIGVVGMAVMGKNLALNIESRGYSVALFNRTGAKTTAVVEEHPDKNFKATYTIEEFVESIEKPRRILLMVKAGPATDATIQELPSIMPGGQKEAYALVAPILEQISAKAEDGAPCVTYIGPNGAGHYVKMVHNGIEYGDMQLIAESYDLMKNILNLSVEEMADIFKEWNQGELDSYLIEITADILTRKDDEGTGKPVVDVILDAAGNKGTGKWTSQSALDLGVPLPLITESVFARYISAYKEERVQASKILSRTNDFEFTGDKKELVEKIREALYFSKIMSYAQGFAQLRVASKEFDWDLPFGEIAKIWRAGCIIRARFLQKITDAYDKNPEIENLLLDDYFVEITKKYQQSVRDVVALAVQAGVPVPTFSSAIAYFDSYRAERLPANIIQAQRDYFGAHTYERVDKEGIFHYSWYHEE